MRIRTAMLMLLTGTLLGCAHGNHEVGTHPLTSSMNAVVQGDSVLLVLNVTNVSEQPVPLVFPSAQQYDFLVRREDGTSVWSWSATRSFAQVLTTDTLAAGDSRRYAVSWPTGGATGSFVAEGRLLAREHGVELAIPLPLDELER